MNADRRVNESSVRCYDAAERLGISVRDVLDFASPVNPQGPANRVKAAIRKHLKDLNRYPDPEARRLRRRISQVFGTDAETVVCTAGSHGAIRLILEVLRPSASVAAPPCPASHTGLPRRGSVPVVLSERSAGEDFSLDPGRLTDTAPDGSVVILGNPNIPAGKLLDVETLVALSDALHRKACTLVVDESFLDFHPVPSAIQQLPDRGNLVVVRSFGPFYGLAGIRAGFVVAVPDLARRLRSVQEPGAVNSLAQQAAGATLGDKAFRKLTLAWCSEEGTYLRQGLESLGCRVYPSAANVLLVRHEEGLKLREHLSHRGILVGTEADFPGLGPEFFGVALQRRKQNARFVREVRHFLERQA